MHFRDTTDWNACLFGCRISGVLHRANPQKGKPVSIRSFHSKIVTGADAKCRELAQRDFADYGLQIYGDTRDEMSGRRGFIQPYDGYNGPKLFNEKKPKKEAGDSNGFTVRCTKECPAVCYFNGEFKIALANRVQLAPPVQLKRE